MNLVYSQDAIEDLARLRRFIAEHGPQAAARIGAQLIVRVQALARFPAMGRSVPEAPDPESMRDAVFGRHVVRYVHQGNAVIILRVWHQAEDRGADE